MNRDYELKELEITILRFTNEEIFNDIEKVLNKINNLIGQLSD